MMIILEGGDMVGKTTLVAALQAKLTRHRDSEHGAGPYYHGGLVMGHYGPPEKDPIHEYTSDIEWYRPGTKIGMLWDRFHLGGPIYGPIYRPTSDREGYGEMGRAGYRWIELFLASRGAVTFLVRQDEDVIRRRFELLGDDSYTGKIDSVLQVNAAYDEFFEGRDCPITYQGNIEGDFIDPLKRKDWVNDITDMIIHTAAHHAEMAKSLMLFPTYVGPRDPIAVLVTPPSVETPHAACRGTLMPYRASAGEWLLDSLPDDLWKQIGMVSATDDLYQLHHVLGYPNVIALGNASGKALDAINMDHSVVPDLRRTMRFRRDDQMAYGALITLAAQDDEPKDYTLD
jgi:hypothetical protein